MTNHTVDSRTSPIRVLVVDDQKMMRSIFKDYANSADDIVVVGAAHNGKEGVEQVFDLEPDVVLMDIEMPEMDGISATRMLQSRKSSAKVLVVSTSYDDRYLAQALRNGASGYLLKTTSPEELISAIRGVHEGSLQFGSGVLQRELSSLAPGGIPSEPDKKVNMPTPVQAEELPTPSNGDRANKADLDDISTDFAESFRDDDSASSLALTRSSERASVQQETTSQGSRELETELSRIRAAYWVLKTEQKKMRRWLEILSFVGAGALAVLFLLVCLVVVV